MNNIINNFKVFTMSFTLSVHSNASVLRSDASVIYHSHHTSILERLIKDLHHPRTTASDVAMVVSVALEGRDQDKVSDALKGIPEREELSVLHWAPKLTANEQWRVLQQAAEDQLPICVAGVALKFADRVNHSSVQDLPEVSHVQRLKTRFQNAIQNPCQTTLLAIQHLDLLIERLRLVKPSQEESPMSGVQQMDWSRILFV